MTTAANTAHKQTIYILADESGRLTIAQYAPTMSYAGRRDSDQCALMQGIFIDAISHDLSLGPVGCHRCTAASWGITTQKGLTCAYGG